MGFSTLKSPALLFIVISTIFLSVSTAGGNRKLIGESASEYRVVSKKGGALVEESSSFRSRMLAVKTNDYGRYDPSPAFGKPPYKLIPN